MASPTEPTRSAGEPAELMRLKEVGSGLCIMGFPVMLLIGFLLAATAQNLRKLAKIFPAPQQTQKA